MISFVCGTCYDFKQVTEWHKKMEEARLQELRKGRELVVQKEEIRYLKNLVSEQERTIQSLEEDIVQQNTVREKHLFTCSQQCKNCLSFIVTNIYKPYTLINSWIIKV